MVNHRIFVIVSVPNARPAVYSHLLGNFKIHCTEKNLRDYDLALGTSFHHQTLACHEILQVKHLVLNCEIEHDVLLLNLQVGLHKFVLGQVGQNYKKRVANCRIRGLILHTGAELCLVGL